MTGLLFVFATKDAPCLDITLEKQDFHKQAKFEAIGILQNEIFAGLLRRIALA